VLIGDAAHASLPTSGQGACQALEDAWHLGRRIPLDGRDLAEALDGFSRDRQPKTRRITFVGRQLARTIFECDPERCRDRDAAARASDHRAAAAGMAAQWSAGLPLSGNPSLVSRG
jgi:2-polyprenyl-6-methoxyphenol hydroxylase-like FAD-dependent oxidoreductase